ncbi:hypothetical protein V8B97DRAFT_1916138 [Scleroderma yunnanense]
MLSSFTPLEVVSELMLMDLTLMSTVTFTLVQMVPLSRHLKRPRIFGITKEFPFFPELHRIFVAHPNVTPIAVTTGVGPHGKENLHLQPLDEPQESQVEFTGLDMSQIQTLQDALNYAQTQQEMNLKTQGLHLEEFKQGIWTAEDYHEQIALLNGDGNIPPAKKAHQYSPDWDENLNF